MQKTRLMPSSSVWLSFFKSSVLVSLVAALVLGAVPAAPAATTPLATSALNALQVKGRAPKTNYSRDQFGGSWGKIGLCDTRNAILIRDLTSITYRDSCTVATGTLNDPYTGKVINFVRGVGTSNAVQIDHVVALSDAWQKGAQKLTYTQRVALYNDPLNLMAVDGPTNGKKSDSDAASWLPPRKAYRCAYVARQISVKRKYHLWVTAAEKSVMQNILLTCPTIHIP